MPLMLSKERENGIRGELTSLFEGMMQALYSRQGARFSISILESPQAQDFINAHAAVLDSGFQKVEMSDAMRRRLTRSDYIFSGIKTFHELNEAFPSLLNPDGSRKPFEQFLNDVRKIDRTYNRDYLRAEYNFVQSSAEMAAKWERFMDDGDRYNLQYRTAHDGRVRPEHAALHNVTLPITDPFWQEYYPPNGWNCRCTVVQVRKSKYPRTPHDEAMALGEEALQRDTKGIFRFNAGSQQKTMPDYNPYTISRCRDCDIAKGKGRLAKNFIPDNELCAACRLVRQCREQQEKGCVIQTRNEILEITEKINITSDRLQTGVYYQTKKSMRRGLSHAYSVEEADMFTVIPKNLDKLTFVRFSPLGEVKDLSLEKDIKNIKKKTERGVTGYNIYEATINDATWIIKTEVWNNRAETAYVVIKKK